MVFDTKTVLGGIFFLILVYLLLMYKFPAVLKALTGGIVKETTVLQGR